MSGSMFAVLDAANASGLDDAAWVLGLRSALRESRPRSVASAVYMFSPDAGTRDAPQCDDDLILSLIDDGHAALSPEEERQLYTSEALCTSATLMLGGDVAPSPVAAWKRRGIGDLFGITAAIGGRGVLVTTAETTRTDPRVLRHGRAVASALRSALALRDALQGQPLESVVTAIFDPDGTCAHAHPRLAAACLDSVRQAIARRESVRGVTTEESCELDVWSSLCSGKFRLADHVDRDGRRFVVLLETGDGPALAKVEARIAELCGRAWSNKQIAFELGMTETAVENQLSRTLLTLGLDGRADLVRLYTQLESLRPGPAMAAAG